MRRGGTAAAMMALALGLACTQQTAPASAGISGTFDLALVDGLLFVTSADRSELRAFNLFASPVRDWVRAPNPLEPLSIPVLERPVSLTRDLRHAVDGSELAGPYVYAFGSGLPEVSVVGADPSVLREVRRLTTPGPVTAVAAIGPLRPITPTSLSQLFIATYSGDGSTIWNVSLPTEGLDAATPLTFRPLATYPRFIVSSMQPIPDRNEVAVALRSLDPAASRTGRAFALRSGDGSERVAFQFPGLVRALQTHPGGEGALAGALMYAILDEEGCTTGACGGVMAVKVSDGTPHDVGQSLVPMRPLRFGGGAIPINIAFAAGIALQVPPKQAGDDETPTFPLVGLVTSSDGNIYFFDAGNGRYIDFLPEPASVVDVQYRDSADAVRPFEEGLGLVRIVTVDGVARFAPEPGEGVARSEVILVVYEGILPELLDLPTTDADGSRFPAPDGARADVSVGDIIQLKLQDGSICPVDLTVSSTDDAGALATADPIPSGCAGRVAFRVRAAGASPYVVAGTSSGHLGRVGHGQDFVAPGQYEYFPQHGDPANPPPLIKFRMEGKPASTERDWRYLINISANFSPWFFRVDTQSQYGLGPGWELPHSVLMSGPATAFASYPSFQGAGGTTGALLEFSPLLAAPNSANVQNLKPYR